MTLDLQKDLMAIHAKPDVLLTEMGDGTAVLLDVATKFYYTLNETGLFVWKWITSGAGPIRGLVDAIVSGFDVERGRAETDVLRLLEDLVQEGLLSG